MADAATLDARHEPSCVAAIIALHQDEGCRQCHFWISADARLVVGLRNCRPDVAKHVQRSQAPVVGALSLRSPAVSTSSHPLSTSIVSLSPTSRTRRAEIRYCPRFRASRTDSIGTFGRSAIVESIRTDLISGGVESGAVEAIVRKAEKQFD